MRIARRTRLHVGALAVALLDLLVQGVLVVLGLAFLLSPETLTEGLGFARGQDWSDLAFALPLAMLAYTGLETVANLAEEATRAGPHAAALALLRDRPRRARHRADRGDRALRVSRCRTARRRSARSGSRRRSSASPRRSTGRLPTLVVDVLEVVVGISGVLILAGAATTSFSGITRLTHSLAEHGSLPREFARLERRAVVSSEAIAIAAVLAIGLIVVTEVAADGDPAFLASLYSFGVLIAFTAAQLAVIRLRMRAPDLARPFRARPNVSVGGHSLPVAALVGAPLTLAIWVLAMITHPGRALRRPGLARSRARRLRRRPPDERGGAARARRPGRDPARRDGVRAHPRADEAR